MTSTNFKQCHTDVRKVLNQVQFTHPTHSPSLFVSGITKILIVIGCISIIAIGLFILHIITSSILLRVIEITIATCLILYSMVVFCVVYNRNKFIKVYRRYPYAVDILRDIRRIEDKSIPNFFHFHKIVYNSWLYERYMFVCSIKSTDLESINNGVSILNEHLRCSCSKYRSETTRFLISTCANKANNQSTYTKLYLNRSIHCKILSIKQLLENSFKSDFAYKCIKDIAENNILNYSFIQEDESRVIANEDEIYVFFESNTKKSICGLNIFSFIIPIIIFFLPCLYIAGNFRKCYVEKIVHSNIYNAKIADAVMMKMDIIEQHIMDSIAFEQRITIPLEYSMHYDSYSEAQYVGGIYSRGMISYNGKDYTKKTGTIMYTYDTDITISSYAEETDGIPDRDKNIETVSFSKNAINSRPHIHHLLTITENRGRYSGYSTWQAFTYSFSVKGPELPGNETISNKMLETYDRSHEEIDIKKIVNDCFFDQILQFNAEDIIEEKTNEYLCRFVYNIDIHKEVEKMKNLVVNRDKYAR